MKYLVAFYTRHISMLSFLSGGSDVSIGIQAKREARIVWFHANTLEPLGHISMSPTFLVMHMSSTELMGSFSSTAL
jgi:hypothetical protein